ncbi:MULTISPECIES: glycosyltransferase [Protofrankia]|uniref:Spore protein YkvP/CgeB glycosyl transferase-like domain-containing protein n=1 Tax=Protofrankia coriariae TaxID=1562887 RepID=A0ABR5F5D8_9ACTN|nr:MULTISPECIES: glycosyltransferase [Protofrankia]KLL11941.1 hypothetical protein FrCorBMG51_07950 [Protofrankia coriariae]ONH36823.1 hypothetical protein BL254_06245 [Protofrankia sp. BMG5.30]
MTTPDPAYSQAARGKPLRVGVIGPSQPDDFGDNIRHCLSALGVEAHALGPTVPRVRGRYATACLTTARRGIAWFDNQLQRRLVSRVADLDLDVVVSVDGRLLPSAVEAMRRQGARVCLWFPDGVANLDRQLMVLGAYDAVFFKEPVLATRGAKVLGLPAYYLPEACNPTWHLPPADVVDQPYLAVVGNVYGTRARLLSRLLDQNVPIRIYGPPIPRWLTDRRLAAAHTGRYVVREEKARIFRGAVGVLNNLHPGEVDGVNCRLFEATACGAAVICEERKVLPELFDVDREVLTFATFERLLAHVRRLIAEPAYGRAIGDAASARSLSDHTYQIRLTRMLEILV